MLLFKILLVDFDCKNCVVEIIEYLLFEVFVDENE